MENVPEQNANDGSENEQRADIPASVPNTNAEDSTLLSSGADEQDENQRLPVIALLRTFILSFFSSLIPETPAV